MTDEQLVTDARNGDMKAFEQFVARRESRVIAFVAARFDGNVNWVEDVAHEVFLKVLYGAYEPRGRFSAWFCRVVVDEIAAFLGKQPMGAPIQGRQGEAGVTWRQTQDDEQIALLRDAVLSLNTIHRDVVLLRFMEELTGAEIAEVLDIDVDTVWSRLNAALRQLRPKLVPRGQGSE